MPKKAKVTDRYDSILLEGIRSDFRIVAESVAVLQDKVVSLEQRFNGLEESVHLQILETKQDLRAYLVETKQEILAQVSGRVEPLESRVLKCEIDIAQLKSVHPQ